MSTPTPARERDVARDAPQRWNAARTKELPPDACLAGRERPRFRLGWEPGRGRWYQCLVGGCGSVQWRR